ncbi:D-Ala-D-Ala carboxypeptidase VanY [Clostridia bacterium]|nr:D-Ala-D-Ala carboxypeptidase VanY [Clostridia bacterium]
MTVNGEERQLNPGKLIALVAVLIIIIAIVATCNKKNNTKEKTPVAGVTTTQKAVTTTAPPVDEKTLVVAETDVILGNLILVNSQHPVQVTGTKEEIAEILNLKNVLENGNDYVHVTENAIDLSKDALSAFASLMTDYYKVNGKDDIKIRNGYSSVDKLFDLATGLSFDIKLRDNFNGSGKYVYDAADPQWFMWVTDHAADYGFIVRYPKGKSAVTLIDADKESDSIFRYVGIPHAKYITENGLVLEEYLPLITTKTKNSPLEIEANALDQVSGLATTPTKYSVYYVSKADAIGGIKYTSKNIKVSGDNMDGFIVTTWN